MKKNIVVLLMAILIITPMGLSWAEEKQDHICFRVVDANQDGAVTFQEFEKVYGSDTDRFNQADADKDGRLSHEEYHHLLGHGSS